MSVTVRSTFGAVKVDGLFSRHDLAEMFAEMYATDADVREALDAARSARQDADGGRSQAAFAGARLEEALGTIADAVPCTAVQLAPDDARQLRELLIKARLGQGRADTWATNRRSA
jgi:hypothetical protein